MLLRLTPSTCPGQSAAIRRSNQPISFTTFPAPLLLTLLAPTPRNQNPSVMARVRSRNDEEPIIEAEARVLERETDEVGGDKEEEFGNSSGFRGVEDDKDYDRDPEFAEILGSCLDDPQKAQTRVEERIRRKRSKILQMKTGSAMPMKVSFNKFEFSNSYIWLEFYNAPLEKDVSLICDTIRSWHIIGRLGGCNSMNMQLSQAPPNTKRPTYDAVQGANTTPTTFYNIGDLEIQDNLARIWVDIGTSEPLLLDVLVNALSCISSDYVGIKQVVFGGKEFENWKETSMTEDPACSVHKI